MTTYMAIWVMGGAERTLGDHFDGESREFTQEDDVFSS